MHLSYAEGVRLIIIISVLRTHVRSTCLHSKNITIKHTRVILCYTIESYIESTRRQICGRLNSSILPAVINMSRNKLIIDRLELGSDYNVNTTRHPPRNFTTALIRFDVAMRCHVTRLTLEVHRCCIRLTYSASVKFLQLLMGGTSFL